jgi:hypothetical protein
VDVDGLGDPLQRLGSRIGHCKTDRTGRLQRIGGDDDFFAVAGITDPCRDVHPLAGAVIPLRRCLAGMDTDPHPWCKAVLAAMLGEPPLDGDRSLDTVSGVIEGDEEPIPGPVQFFTRTSRM